MESQKAEMEASRTPAMPELTSNLLQATLLGHTPNSGGISAKKGEFFREVCEQFETGGV
jgi:hypothetical protein